MVNDGLKLLPGFLSRAEQEHLMDEIAALESAAPYYTPVMPRTGRPFSVTMTNAGALGWVSDRSGYRYQATHPVTQAPWPAIPQAVLDVWSAVSGTEVDPECCLVNRYGAPKSKMGLHRDEDEDALTFPVVSISLGDTAVFRIGGPDRKSPTRSVRLASGDVVVLGGASRNFYHGIDRVLAGTSTLVPGGGRINLTLRRVTAP